MCHEELNGSARTHIASCTVTRVQTEDARQRARATQETQQAQERAEMLRAEAESLMTKAARLFRQRAGDAA